MSKRCSGPCNTELSLDNFHKGTGKFGVKSRCIKCCKLTYKHNSKEYKKNYYLQNLEKSRVSRLFYRENHKEEYKKYGTEYDKRHRPERAAREAFRRAQKLNATPKWLTKDHKKTMTNLYLLRDELGLKEGIIYHVDHVVPLISELVCGLHVPWNLQVIPAKLNQQKSNRF